MNYNLQLHHFQSVNPTCLFSYIVKDKFPFFKHAISFAMTSSCLFLAKCIPPKMFNGDFALSWDKKEFFSPRNVAVKCTTTGEQYLDVNERDTKTRKGQAGNTRKLAPKCLVYPVSGKLLYLMNDLILLWSFFCYVWTKWHEND